MRIALLVTGSEILDGHVTDANTGHLARELARCGAELSRAAQVRDDAAAISAAVSDLARDHAVVVVSGGIGPTDDDVTMAAVARAARVRLRGGLPAGAERLKNGAGTADGALTTVGTSRVYVFAGVPAEFAHAVGAHLLPRLRRTLKDSVTDALILKSFGMRESRINELVGKKLSRVRGLSISYLPVFPEIHLRLSATGSHYKNLLVLNRGEDIVREALGAHLWGVGDQTLPGVMGARLRESGLKLAVAESCTGGMIAGAITDAPGSSDYFVLGAVTYANDTKVSVLGVNRGTILRHGAVSRQAVEEMSAGVMRLSGAHVTAAVSGVAGPAGGTREKPVGTVHIAVRVGDRLHDEEHVWDLGRERFRAVVTWRVLWLIWKLAGEYAEGDGVGGA